MVTTEDSIIKYGLTEKDISDIDRFIAEDSVDSIDTTIDVVEWANEAFMHLTEMSAENFFKEVKNE